MKSAKMFLRITFFILISFFLSPVLFARTISCKVIDQEGKTAGYYSHSSNLDPVCDCKNLEIPDNLISVCTRSVKEVY